MAPRPRPDARGEQASTKRAGARDATRAGCVVRACAAAGERRRTCCLPAALSGESGGCVPCRAGLWQHARRTNRARTGCELARTRGDGARRGGGEEDLASFPAVRVRGSDACACSRVPGANPSGERDHTHSYECGVQRHHVAARRGRDMTIARRCTTPICGCVYAAVHSPVHTGRAPSAPKSTESACLIALGPPPTAQLRFASPGAGMLFASFAGSCARAGTGKESLPESQHGQEQRTAVQSRRDDRAAAPSG